MDKLSDGTTEWIFRDKRLFSLLDIIYPVGSIYTTVAEGTPFSAVGFGTWEEVGAGRVLQGASFGHAAGTTIEAGLPNITGGMTTFSYYPSKPSSGASTGAGCIKVTYVNDSHA